MDSFLIGTTIQTKAHSLSNSALYIVLAYKRSLVFMKPDLSLNEMEKGQSCLWALTITKRYAIERQLMIMKNLKNLKQ